MSAVSLKPHDNFREEQTAISVNNKCQFEYTEVRVTSENDQFQKFLILGLFL